MSLHHLQALSVQRSPPPAVHVRPPRRWFSRIVLPLGLLLGFLGLIGWSSWEMLFPGTPVTVTPVMVRAGVRQSAAAELFTATGWLEPAPTPIETPALAEGVVESLYVLPGQHVREGDLLAKLVDHDARLALASAMNELRERQMRREAAQADLVEAQAQLRGAEAALKGDEELYRDKVIGSTRLELTTAQRAVAQARVEQARARLREAEARVTHAETLVEIAQLRLDRMTIRAPRAGIVMSLNTVPGRMVGGRGLAGTASDTLVTLYDARFLQVRVEVPIDKFRHVQPGQPARVEFDVAPDFRFQGTVLYDTHETDIQRNTVRVKVSIERPVTALPPVPWPLRLPAGLAAEATATCAAGVYLDITAPHNRLRPGMIATVRIQSAAGSAQEATPSVRILVPHRLLQSVEGASQVWIVDQGTGRAVLKPVVVGPEREGDWVEVKQGLELSDKLVVGGRELLRSGARVQIVGEEP